MSEGEVSDRLSDLETEVGFLLRRVSQLSDEKDKLVEEVDFLKEELRSRDGANEEGLDGFSLVDEPARVAGEASSSRSTGARSRGVAARAVARSDKSTQTEVAPEEKKIPSKEERIEIARGIGQFFKRCIDGERVPRGLSGRDLVPLQNRYYVVIRDFQGRIYRAARVFHSWKPAKAVLQVEGSNSFGESVFCGFATLWEAEVAVREAGYLWPGKEYWGYDGR